MRIQTEKRLLPFPAFVLILLQIRDRTISPGEATVLACSEIPGAWGEGIRRRAHFLLFPIVLKLLALSQKCVQPSI